MDVFSAMTDRRSARAYLNRPVSRADIEDILKYAGKAPSAINLQPWEYVIVYGEEKDRLVKRLQKAHAERGIPCGPGTQKPLPDILKNRSRRASRVMAPKIAEMGLEFNQFIDRLFPKLRYLDVGLSVSYLLLAAQAHGLATCPIGLISSYGAEAAQILDISEDKEIVLGIALGYADNESPINNFRTDRENLDNIRFWYE